MSASSDEQQARARLRPYVSGLAQQWLETTPDSLHRAVPGSLAFVDISGFTALTEKLATKGKVGAEEMSDLLNGAFAELLEQAYAYGASLVKWGGDAVLLLFEGDEHAHLASRGAYEMRRTMRRVGRLRTSVGTVQLRMSVGIHSGTFDFFMAGTRHHELLIAGPGATTTARMEQVAEAGEIVVSAATAALLPPSSLGEPKGDGILLATPPRPTPRTRYWTRGERPADPGTCLDPAIRDQLLTEVGDNEHRQVAVGFVEVSGVDDLLARQGPGAVAAALHELMTVVQEECAHHAITFWETDISADGFKVMLVAGAPRSSGRDEEGMLRGTRAMLDRHGGPVRVRIGVNCGRVFSGGFGPPFRRTWSVKGDAVNLAARVMGKASAGTLVATEALLRRVPARVDAELLEPFMVKGKRQPVRAAVVSQITHDRVADDAAASTFVGRHDELGAVLDASRQAQSGRGCGVAILGAAGVGKSRLVDHACARFGTEAVVLRGFADAYESSTPYYAVRRLLRDAIGVSPDAPEAHVVDRLEGCVRRRAPHLAPWLPLLAAPFGVDLPDTSETAEVQAQFRLARTQSLVVELLACTLQTAATFVVDDVHFADDASALLVARLVAEASSRAWLVLLVGRELPASIAEDDVTVVTPTPLTADEATALIFDTPGSESLLPHVVRSIVERGEGNPMFLRELTSAAVASQGEDLPSTLEETLAAQIDALAPAERKVLRAVSVVGIRCDERLAEVVLGEPLPPDVWQRLEHFLACHDDGSRRFRTALVRDTAYEGLPYRQRVELHGRAADALERLAGDDGDDRCEALSLHCLAAQRYEQAWRYSRLAGERAQRMYANPEALTFHERARMAARKLPTLPPPAVAALLEAMGDVHARLGQLDAASGAFKEARKLAAADDVALRARAALGIGLAATKGGHAPLATRWFSIATRETDVGLHERVDPALAELHARTFVERAAFLYRQSRHAESAQLCEAAVRAGESAGAELVVGRALHLLDANEVAVGRASESDRLTRALSLFERCGDLSWQASVWNELGIHAYYEGDWNRAAECYERARSLRARVGDEWGALVCSANLAEILIDQGRLHDGERLAREALRVWRALDTPGDVGFAASLVARACAYDGRYDEASVLLDEAIGAFASAGEALAVADSKIQAAELLALQGHALQAAAHLDAAIGSLNAALGAATNTSGSGRATSADVSPEAMQAAAVLRLRGYIEGQVGHDADARGCFEASLSTARERDSVRDVALAIDGIAWLVPGSDSAERDAIFAKLGIVTAPAFPRHATRPGTLMLVPDQRVNDRVAAAGPAD